MLKYSIIFVVLLLLTSCGASKDAPHDSSFSRETNNTVIEASKPAIDIEINNDENSQFEYHESSRSSSTYSTESSSENESSSADELSNCSSQKEEVSSFLVYNNGDFLPGYADEMTVRIIDKDGVPVKNIGVYCNASNNGYLYSAVYAVTDKDGIAILQRVRKTYMSDEKITIGLCDRNQAKQYQQSYDVLIPKDFVTSVDLIWNGITPSVFAQQAENKIVFKFVDKSGNPQNNLWLHFTHDRASNGDNTQKHNPAIGYWDDMEYDDINLCTDSGGQAIWVNPNEGAYFVDVRDGLPIFNLVVSTHPRLQIPYGNQERFSFDYSGGREVIEIIWQH